MKKNILLLILLLGLVGCKKSVFSLDSKYYNNKDIVVINDIDFNNLINNKESFIVFIYDSTCITCREFNNVLQEFVDKEGISIYKLSYKDMKNTNLKNDIKYYPSLAIFNRGKLVSFLDAQSDDDTMYYKSYENVKIWISKYIKI